MNITLPQEPQVAHFPVKYIAPGVPFKLRNTQTNRVFIANAYDVEGILAWIRIVDLADGSLHTISKEEAIIPATDHELIIKAWKR